MNRIRYLKMIKLSPQMNVNDIHAADSINMFFSFLTTSKLACNANCIHGKAVIVYRENTEFRAQQHSDGRGISHYVLMQMQDSLPRLKKESGRLILKFYAVCFEVLNLFKSPTSVHKSKNSFTYLVYFF